MFSDEVPSQGPVPRAECGHADHGVFGDGAQELRFTCIPVACSDHAIAMGGQRDLMSGSKLGNAAPVATNPNGECANFPVHYRRTGMESQTGHKGAILLKCVVLVAVPDACVKDGLETLVLPRRQTLGAVVWSGMLTAFARSRKVVRVGWRVAIDAADWRRNVCVSCR